MFDRKRREFITLLGGVIAEADTLSIATVLIVPVLPAPMKSKPVRELL